MVRKFYYIRKFHLYYEDMRRKKKLVSTQDLSFFAGLCTRVLIQKPIFLSRKKKF